MGTPRPHYSREEFARRGDDVYDRVVAPRLREEDLGKFVLMNIGSEDYEIDRDEIAASDLARPPSRSAGVVHAGRFPLRAPVRGTAPLTAAHVIPGSVNATGIAPGPMPLML